MYVDAGSTTPTVTYTLIDNGGIQGSINPTSTNIMVTTPSMAGLGALQYNGGLSMMVGAPNSQVLLQTMTVALLAGSPAIDAGSNIAAAGITTDERGPGFNRIINGGISLTVDMGAYEYQPPTTTIGLGSSVNPSALGQSVIFTATVVGTAAGSNTVSGGSVTFAIDGTTVATVTVSGGTATFTTTTLAAGSHAITAQYVGFSVGDYSFSNSSTTTPLTQTVNANSTAVTLTSSANPSLTAAAVTFTATVNTSVPPGFSLTGTVSFFNNGNLLETTLLNGNTAIFTTIALLAGRDSITAVYNSNGNFSTNTSAPLVQLVSAGIYAIGADAGGTPLVTVYNHASHTLISINAFPINFTGGVRVAVGDVNGDGIPDIIAAAGPGGGPQINVYDGQTFHLIDAFYAFPPTFTGGLFVAAGDLYGQGYADIIVGADKGGLDEVEVFDGKSTALVAAFYPFGLNATGGVRVAAGDLTGSGHDDIIAGAGPGELPQVSAFDGSTLNFINGFNAYTVSFTGGVYVAAGNLFGSGRADIITGPGAGGGPLVNVFDGISGNLVSAFYAAPQTFTGGVRVTAHDISATGQDAIITGAGPGGLSQTTVLDGSSLAVLDAFFAYDPMFHGGEFVG